MGVTIASAAASQWPLGAISDRVDRRMLACAVTLLSAGAGLLLWTTAEGSAARMLIGGGLFGSGSIFRLPCIIRVKVSPIHPCGGVK